MFYCNVQKGKKRIDRLQSTTFLNLSGKHFTGCVRSGQGGKEARKTLDFYIPTRSSRGIPKSILLGLRAYHVMTKYEIDVYRRLGLLTSPKSTEEQGNDG